MKKLLLITSLIVSTLAVSAQNTSQSYIEKFKDNAVRIMHETGVPASIVLAVAMHESGNGNSKIARNLNNQFGVKGYDAHVYTYDNKKVRTYYRKYNSVLESFQDFARIMTERKQFSHLAENLSHYDYLGWAKGIQRSGYCSSHKWSAQVLAIIRKYNLNAYDENPQDQKQLAETKQ
ncbi:glucosaminidase domain-containing protein [Mucilaginibacter sp. BT774]|uniref:glucosaminidase domain-containing protein n=1 Tax=Mucilaginibacter sp. BT774 TaxID=3062276 RepID=UPI00267479ED|nr:glucosaminidase domain-containing protein [Mucilaginibacter sp. BT774]MDO3626683.1 glucosaminidase domain-containing protein [Mucilaginibacter sp. BT774]